MPYIERNDLAQERSAAENLKYNPSVITEVPEDFGIKRVAIYIYNISNQEFNVPRPPNHPHMLIRRCPVGQEYLMVGQITHPFDEVFYDSNLNKGIRQTNGYKEATKMMNPANPGTDQEFDIEGFNQNDNLNAFGVFWSMNNPPTAEELAAAKARLMKTYRKELETLVAIEAKEGPDGARARANDISHAAANYFGQSYSWHRTDLVPKDVNVGKVDCGACGEKIMPTARLCMHCGAPSDPIKLESWLEAKFAEKRGPGRPPANA